MPPGAALALDVGTAKIGVAYTDAGRRIAFPGGTLARRSVAKDTAALATEVRRREATMLVVGLPPEERLARLARQVGDALAQATGLPLAYVDEAYTSTEARLRLGESGGPRTAVDAVAAQLILEAWLASTR